MSPKHVGRTFAMDHRAAKIVTLRRYIWLLRQEENRLGWVRASAMANVQDRADAESAWQQNAQKLQRADKELRETEAGVGPSRSKADR
jgi:hypothetical protein